MVWHSMISNQIFPEKSLWLFRWVFDSKQNIYTTFFKQKCARPHPVVLYIYNPFYFLPIFHIHSLGYITPGSSKLLQKNCLNTKYTNSYVFFGLNIRFDPIFCTQRTFATSCVKIIYSEKATKFCPRSYWMLPYAKLQC